MRNFVFRIVLTIIAILSFNSCYEPTGANYNEVEIPQPPESISIDYYTSGDTIFWVAGSSLHFTFSAGGAELRWARLVFDNDETAYSDCKVNETGFYTYDCGRLQPGVHKMDVYIFTKTYSGSLADIMNAEGFVGKRRWTLIFANAAPEIAYDTVENAIQTLVLNIKNQYFQKLYLQKINYSYDFENIDSANGLLETKLRDRFYVGESASYRIVGAGTDGDNKQSLGYGCTSKIPIPKISSNTETDIATFSWTRSPYDSAFQCYRLSVGLDPVVFINDINQTSVDIPLGCDVLYDYYSFAVVPKNQHKDFFDENFVRRGYLTGGTDLPEPISHLKNPGGSTSFVGYAAGKLIYLIFPYTVVRYNPETNEIEDSVNVPFLNVKCSQDGNYLLCYDSYIYQFCLVDFRTKKVFPVHNWGDLGFANEYGINCAGVSNNGIVASCKSNYTTSVYDAVNSKLIGSVPNYWIVAISPDGKLLEVGSNTSCELYRIGESNLEKTSWHDGSASLSNVSRATFLGNNDFTYLQNQTLTTVNLYSKNVISTIPVTNSDLLLIDPYNRKVGIDKSEGAKSKFNIYDISSGDVVGYIIRKNNCSNLILAYPYIINSAKSKVRIHS